MIGIVEVIVSGFVGGSLSSNPKKRYLRAVMAVDNKKVKLDDVKKNAIILSFDND